MALIYLLCRRIKRRWRLDAEVPLAKLKTISNPAWFTDNLFMKRIRTWLFHPCSSSFPLIIALVVFQPMVQIWNDQLQINSRMSSNIWHPQKTAVTMMHCFSSMQLRINYRTRLNHCRPVRGQHMHECDWTSLVSWWVSQWWWSVNETADANQQMQRFAVWNYCCMSFSIFHSPHLLSPLFK